MRIISLNANGIRAAARKGFYQWLPAQGADVVCLQEVRAHGDQLPDDPFRPADFHCHYHFAARKGYGGVAIYSRRAPDAVIEGTGWEDVDSEGRWLEARFGKLSVVSLYVPSGSSGEARQAFKFSLMNRLMDRLRALRRKRREYVICGDWNIAHKVIDIENWRGNQKNSGFLPEERAWMDELFGPVGYVDAFRVVNQEARQYTWWSNRGRAWDKNVGWRLDYQVVTPGLRAGVRAVDVYKSERFSDHAPLTIDYALD